MQKDPREVLLVGSIPLRPAAKVFQTVAKHLGLLVRRIPDGEQIGWSGAVRRTIERHESFEVSRQIPLNAGGRDPINFFRLRKGYKAEDVKLGPYGCAENATRSYAAFKQLQDEGSIPPNTRYQATLPGPGTSAFFIELPADKTAEEERTKALDPALSPDPKQAREAMQDAEFVRDRLKTLLPRLQTRYLETVEAEALAAWRAEADELEPRGVALLDGFVEFYPEMAKRIANHLDDLRAFDKQVDDLNRRRPSGVSALSRSTPALAKDLRIPSPYKTDELWWPPPQPNLALASMPPDPFLIHEAAKGTYIKERDRRALEDNRRQIAEAEQRQREFEKQQAAEAAKERDRQAYRERGWPRG